MSGARARVRAPATSANLGPGYDSFGLALSLHDEVEAELTGSGVAVDVTGEGAGDVRRDGGHLVVRAMRAAFDRLGVAAPPGIALSCVNRIPHGRGLGSSAAAIVSGIRLAEALSGGRGFHDEEVLCLATEMEGHPDNVAACLFGGFTVSWVEGERPRAVRFDVHADVRPVVWVPPTALATSVARGLLPDVVPHEDAAANSARAALLVAALTRDPELLLSATRDRLHQDYRRPAMTESLDLVDALRSAGLAAVVSGAGPTVLALTNSAAPMDVDRWTPAGWTCLELRSDGAATTTVL